MTKDHSLVPSPPKTARQKAKSNHKVEPSEPLITSSTDRTFMSFLEQLTSVSLSPNQIGDAISLAITYKAPFSAASRELAKVAPRVLQFLSTESTTNG